MALELRISIIILGIIFALYILSLLLNRKIEERNAFLYIFGASVFGFLAIFPKLLDVIAEVVGVDYPPTLLFTISIVILITIAIHQSIQISILEKQVKEISELTALQIYIQKNKDGELGGK